MTSVPQPANTYVDWDLNNIWNQTDGHYPWLRWQETSACPIGSTIDTSLKLNMRFDNIDSYGNPVDSSLYMHHGTLQGDALISVNGYFGDGLLLDGDQDHVLIGDIDFTDQMTGAVWVKFNEVESQQVIIAQSANVEYQLQLGGPLLSGKFKIRVDNTSGNRARTDSTTEPLANTWYHVAWTYDGSDIKIYVNGVHESTNNESTATGNIADHNETTGIGAQNFGWGAVNGTLDEVLIFDRALSSAEVAALFNASESEYLSLQCMDLP